MRVADQENAINLKKIFIVVEEENAIAREEGRNYWQKFMPLNSLSVMPRAFIHFIGLKVTKEKKCNQ